MRSIGWLNIIRENNVYEVLNDLRFLKNASDAGIVTRVMDDTALCELYNYQWDGCAIAGPEPEPAQNAIYEITPGSSDLGEGFYPQNGGTQGPFIYNTDNNAQIKSQIESIFAGADVIVTGGPFPATVTVEFAGASAGVNVDFSLTDPIGPDPTLNQIQAGSPGIVADVAFDLIDWNSDAPWVSDLIGADPGETEFLGIWVENWEGLEGEFERTVNQRGWSFGGANFTPLRARHLSMTYEVILGATTERGLQYGFRWLSSMLYGLDQCDRAELVLFDNCPPAATPQEDWPYWLIREAGVLDMPRWGDTLMETKNCALRRVTFVLGARDPHKYKCPVVCTEETEFEVPEPTPMLCNGVADSPVYTWSQWFCNDDLASVCCNFDPPTFGRTSRAAIVHLTGGDNGCAPCEITFEDDGNALGTFRTMPLPASSELIIDSSRHELRFRTSSMPAGEYIDGSAYINAGFGTSVAWAEATPLGPLAPAVCVRPLRICGLAGAQVMIETVDRV